MIAPAVGGGFGSKLNVYAEELIALALARRLGVPVRWTEDRTENADRHHPGPRPDPGHRAGRRRRRQGHRGPGAAAGRHGRLPAAGHARHPAARRLPLPRRLRRPGLLVHVHGGVHEQDADRRLPRRRPARGHLRHRAGHGRAGPRRSASTRPRSGGATSSRPSSSRTRRPPGSSSTPATTSRPSTKALELVGYDDLRGRAGRAAGRRATPTHLGIGISTYVEMCGLAPSRVLASLNYGAGGWESATVRLLPTGKVAGRHRHDAARPGPRDALVDDRGRQARRRPRRRRGAPLRHRHLADSAWTPTGPARSPSAAWRSCMAADQVLDKARTHRRPPAGGGRGRPRVRRAARSG